MDYKQDEDLPDYKDEPSRKEETKKAAQAKTAVSKGGYAGVHSAGFSEFLLRPELLNAI
jgi:hypothetical protein